MAKPTYIQPNFEEWQKKFQFYTEIKVRYCETDMSGHVNNTSYLVYFEQARVEYLERLATIEGDLIVVTADIWCHYHAEAIYPEILEVGVRVARIGSTSLDLEYIIRSMSDGRLIVTGAGTIVLVNRTLKQPALIPDVIKDRIAKLEKHFF